MYQYFKPALDIILAFTVLLALSPLLFLITLSILVFMGRPIFFRQDRPGKDYKIFKIFKFRTMSEDRDDDGRLLNDKQRLKGFGALLRSSSLDELPQLFNILKGEMSFIGPRPLLVEYLSLYSPHQAKRHRVKPGITGLAQVKGRNNLSWRKKFQYDIFYVKHLSLALDFKIIIWTIIKILIKEGINNKNQTCIGSEKFDGTN